MAVGIPMKTTYANGDVFSASDVNDITGTINLIGYGAPFVAGKNKIINGDFYWNQRNFTSNTTDDSYNFDRWFQSNSGGTVTVTPQTFTLGAAPVSGYEANNYVRVVTASQTLSSHYTQYRQKIENVRTFAGQTVTLSFWAKASTGTPKIAPMLAQYFGSGGSPSANVNTTGTSVTLSTSWARYTATIAVPSISGKTLGTTNNNYLGVTLWLSAGADYNSLSNSLGLQNATIDIWGVQLESGTSATNFTTATNSIGGELALCQRYYIKFNDSTNAVLANGNARSTTGTNLLCNLPTSMRVRPTSLEFTSLQISDGASNYAVTSLTSGLGTQSQQYLDAGVASGLTQFRPMFLQQNGSTGYVAFSAEL